MARKLQFDVSALDRASAAFARIAVAVEALAARLEALDNKRVEPEIVVKTREAEREVGRFAARMQRQIQEALNRLPSLTISTSADSTALADLRRQLATLSARRIGVDIDADEAKRQVDEIAAKLRQLASRSTSFQVRADAAAALRDLDGIEERKKQISRTPVQIKTDNKGIRELINSTATLSRSLALLATFPAVIAATPAIGALGNAVVEATGVLGLVPGLLAAVGIAAGTAAIGFRNFSDALDTSNLAKANEALAKLSPSARAAAVEIRGLAKEFDAIKVQEALFSGLAKPIAELGRVHLPGLKGGFQGVAAAMNAAAKEWITWASAPKIVGDVGRVFEGVRQSVQQLGPGLSALSSALLDIAVVGTGMLPRLSAGLTSALQKFKEFTAAARESGRMEQWIQRGINAVKTLGSILGNIGGSFRAFFAAAESAGAPLLATLDRATAAMEKFLKSGEGQAGLIATFQTIKGAVEGLMPGITAIGRAILDAFKSSGPEIQAAAAALGQIAVALAPAIPAIVGIVAALTPLLQLLAALVGALGPIPAAILTAVAAFRLLSAVGATLAAPFLALATRSQAAAQHMTVLATGTTRAATAARTAGTAFGAVGTALGVFGRFLGGPVAAAILTVIGLLLSLVGASNDAAAAMAANRAAVDELRATLDGLTGSATRATVELQATKNATTEFGETGKTVAQVAQEMGIQLNTLARAQLGEKAALDQVNAALQQKAQQLILASDAYKTAAPLLQQYGIGVDQLAQAAMGSEPALKSLNDQIARIENDAARQALSQLLTYLLDAAAPARDFGNAIGVMNAQLRQAAAEQARIAASLANVDVAVQGAGSALKQYVAALDQTTGQVREGVAGATELSAALQKVAQDATATAVGAALAAEAQGNIAGAAKAAADSMNASREQFIGAARAAGLGAVEANRLADALGLIPAVAETRYQLLGASQAVQQVGEIVARMAAVPGQKEIHVTALTQEAIALLDSLGLKVKQLPDGTFKIILDDSQFQAKLDAAIAAGMSIPDIIALLMLDPGNFLAQLDAAIADANGRTATPKLDLDTAEGQAKLDALLDRANNTPFRPILDLDTSAAEAKLAAFTSRANSLQTMSTHDLNPAPAVTKLASFQSSANSLRTMSTHDANTGPATNKLAAFERAANALRTQSTHTVTDNTAQVLSRIRSLNGQNTSSTHTIRVVTVGSGPKGAGPINPRAARGGIMRGMAAGGLLGAGFRAMPGGVASIVPPNTWRLIGDRMRDDEAYIPINGSQRSRKILESTARQMGYGLLPRQMASQGAARDAMGRIRSAIGPTISDAKVDRLIDLLRLNRPIVVEDRTGNPVATGRATALALRMF